MFTFIVSPRTHIVHARTTDRPDRTLCCRKVEPSWKHDLLIERTTCTWCATSLERRCAATTSPLDSAG